MKTTYGAHYTSLHAKGSKEEVLIQMFSVSGTSIHPHLRARTVTYPRYRPK